MTSSSEAEDELVARYFHDHATQFDDIYRVRERGVRGLRDRLSRGTVIERLRFADDVASRIKPERVLDVGCGSGRFAVDLAERGARVVGLDFAPDMVGLARELADQEGVSSRCLFLQQDFMTWDEPGRFDMGLAVGVTDYVRDPAPLVKRIAEHVSGTVLISFPARWHPLVPLRWLRLRAARCPVYFYSRSDVEGLGRGVFNSFEVRPLGRDFLLVGDTR
jgi:2-polyprenyl-3-methyl-5-hydroxy-6-metoxy-1,4-benzoquinol methylase